MKLSDFAIDHPAVITIVLAVVVAFGVLAVTSLIQELIPETTQPSVIIATFYPGAAAEDVEREVTDPIENAVSALSGVSSVTSNSRETSSMVTVTFDYEVDYETKIGEVREELDNIVTRLPDDVDGPPVIFRLSSGNVSVYTAEARSSWDTPRLSRYLEDRVVPRLSRIPGVADVNLNGDVSKEVRIAVDIDRLGFYGVSLLEIHRVVQANNDSVPAGDVRYRSDDLSIRTEGRYETLEEIENLVVGFQENTYIRLRDVATVSRVPEPQEFYFRSGGQNAVTIDIVKMRNADVIDLVEEATTVLAEVEEESGGQVRFNTLADTSQDIQVSMNGVQSSALYGGLLAVVILFIFLVNARTTIIIAVSIPLSIVVTFVAMYLGNQTLNLMTLGGLTVGIGMIVDSSIVVLENIYRHRSEGQDLITAARVGAGEVAGAILASTTTSLCVFLPLLFVEGLAGEILGPTAFTIVFALLASLMVAVLVVPYLAVKLLKPGVGQATQGGRRLARLVHRGMSGLGERYRRGVDWALGHAPFVLASAVILLGFAVAAFVGIGFEYIPSTDMNEFHVYLEGPGSFSVEDTRDLADDVDAVIRDLVPELETGIMHVGQDGAVSFARSDNKVFGRYRLVPADQRDRSVYQVIDLLNDEISARVPDVNATLVNGGLDATTARSGGDLTGIAQGFTVNLTGQNLEELIDSARIVRDLLAQDPAVRKAELGIDLAQRELQAEVDHVAAVNAGLTTQEVAATLRAVFFGLEAGEYLDEGEEIPIRLTSTAADQPVSRDILNRVTLKSQNDDLVSLAGVAELRLNPTVTEIDREDGLRKISVDGIMRTDNLRPTQERMTAALEAQEFPRGIQWEIGGTAAELQTSFAALTGAIIIAVFLVYAVMVIQFERFDQPFMVMGAVPFILIGVVLMLLLTGTNLSIVTLLGIIALVGIVVNNAIVLIDYTNLLRVDYGVELRRAVVEGAATRLRPILMTTLTTLLGVAPLAFRAS
ncbi:MAG: efflux RND transporter permease subunit, partial [Spirochaetota bacterium]